jgi:ubiquinone/menaquinone biosynthesis C-methylase UbiE
MNGRANEAQSGRKGQTPATARDSAAWSRYWARGTLHSCPNAFQGNYGEEIRTLWLEYFSSLPSGARVLDIGTGNGAVAFLAQEAARATGRELLIEAIDAAEIDPLRAAKAHGLSVGDIVFRGRTPCESTEYPPALFDAVASQYALEYTRVRETLAEMARILKPGGRALFVIHHADSVALTTTRDELDALSFLKHEAPIVIEAQRFVQRLATGRNPAEIERLANDGESWTHARSLERMLKRTVERARSHKHETFLEAIAAQVATAVREARATGPIAALQRLHALTTEMAAHRDRLAAILRAAHTAKQIEELTHDVGRAGFEAEPATELKIRGDDLVGWVLRATRVANP